MQVNKVESVKTQLTYRFYDLPFCAPEEVEDLTESLGQVLSGDRMENSLYEFFAKYNEYCKVRPAGTPRQASRATSNTHLTPVTVCACVHWCAGLVQQGVDQGGGGQVYRLHP